MFNKSLLKAMTIALVGCAMIVLAACSRTPAATPTAALTQTPTQTSVPPTPSVTPEPLAARVNGQGILLSDYQAELERLKNAQATLQVSQDPAQQSQKVLDELVAEELLAQAAYEAGFRVDDTALQTRLEALTAQTGGSEALQAWMSQNGYTEDSFRLALKRAMAAAWQRDQVLAELGNTAEQIHASQILVRDEKTAQSIYNQLQAGMKFATLAQRYDPLTGGELGWFPKGYLLLPQIEQAAFSLEVGQYSEVIATEYGYHIVQVIERVQNHPLSPDALQALQAQVLQQWLQERQAQSQIERLLP